MNDELERELRSEAESQELEGFFRKLVSSYVNFPDNLKLELKKSYRSWALMIEPDVCDYAIVAGKKGRNFNALKVLVDRIGSNAGIEIEMLLEGPPADDNRHIRKQLPYKVNPGWNPELIKAIVAKTLRYGGMGHVVLKVMKNKVVGETNPFDDQSFYWFLNMKSKAELVFVLALGQLMESIGTAQGQRLVPKPNAEQVFILEKAG